MLTPYFYFEDEPPEFASYRLLFMAAEKESAVDPRALTFQSPVFQYWQMMVRKVSGCF